MSFEKAIFIVMTRKEKKMHQHTYFDFVILVFSFKITRNTVQAFFYFMHQTVIKSLCRGDVKWCFIMIMNLEIKLWLLVYYNSRFTLNIIALSNIKSATWGVFCWTIFFFLTSSINISLYPAKFWLGLANNKTMIIFFL